MGLMVFFNIKTKQSTIKVCLPLQDNFSNADDLVRMWSEGDFIFLLAPLKKNTCVFWEKVFLYLLRVMLEK